METSGPMLVLEETYKLNILINVLFLPVEEISLFFLDVNYNGVITTLDH